LLTISIITIKFSKTKGVPVGTECAIIFFVLFFHPNIIILDQSILAVEKEIIICALGVNVKGVIAVKLSIIIDKKIINKILMIPFLLLFLKRGFNSFSIGDSIILINLFHLIEIIIIIFVCLFVFFFFSSDS